MKFRKIPVVINAVRYDGENFEEIHDFMGDSPYQVVNSSPNDKNQAAYLHIRTLEGTMIARPGDWIIRGYKGEVYPCKDDIFREKYEVVDEQTS